jgi:hypothetical protein
MIEGKWQSRYAYISTSRGGPKCYWALAREPGGGCQTEQEMNTLLTAAWLSYTLGSAPVALFDGGCRNTAGKSAQLAKRRSQSMMGRGNVVQSGLRWNTGMGPDGATALGRAIT